MCGANNHGALYELSAKGKSRLLHSFEWADDGAYPYGEVWRSGKGTLFGTSAYGYGVVWSYVP